MTKQVTNREHLREGLRTSEYAAECPPAERFVPFDLVLTFWPNGGLVYSSFDAPQRTTLPEMTWLSAVMSVRSKSAANSGGSRRTRPGKGVKEGCPRKDCTVVYVRVQ